MSNIKALLDLYDRNHKALIYNPVTGIIHIDKPTVDLATVKEDYYDTLPEVLNAKGWNSLRGKSASKDAASLADVFLGPFADHANDMFTGLQNATQDRSKAAAIITSQDYSILQQAVVIGETMDEIKTGVLAQALPEIMVPTLKGEYLDWATGVQYYTNVPEGKAVDPTKGTVTSVEYTIPKGMGGVAITERAKAAIYEADVWMKNINELQRQRLKKENALVATELETATTQVSGVDFGAVSGTPPVNTARPEALWLTLTDLFDGFGGMFNAIMSKNQAYNEYINNQFVIGNHAPMVPVQVNEMSGPVPGLNGVTWYRDNAISDATKLWAMDLSRAIKGLRSALRSFQIENLKEESTEYYIKSYYIPEIVDQNFIREVTGVTA